MRWLLVVCLLSLSTLAGAIVYTDMSVMRIIQVYAYRQSWVTNAQFRQLQNGISYREAVAFLGRPGREVSSTRIPTTMGEFVVTTYSWHNVDGSSIILVFMDDELIEKARIGLD